MTETTPLDRRELQPCSLCGKGVLHAGTPVFYELAFGTCVADIRSIQQQHGLEQMLGAAAALAPVFAPSTVVAHRLPAVRHLICSDCVLQATPPLVFLDDENGGSNG